MEDEDWTGFWFATHALILEDEKIEILIEDHGHEAFTMVMGLLCQAALQRRGGVVEFTVKRFSEFAHTSREKVREVIPAAAEVDFIEIREDRGRAMTIYIKEWKKWQQNFRKAKSRAKKKEESQPGHDQVTDLSLNRTEQTEQKQDRNSSGPSPSDAPLSHLLADLIAGNTGRRPRIGKGWFDAERLLFSADGRDPMEAERLLRWSQQDDFWRGNILSMGKFRKQYDQLLLHAKREPNFTAAPLPRPQVEVTDSPEAIEAWNAAQPELKRKLQESSWRMWIEPIRAVGRVDSRLALAAPDQIVTWVERRYLEVVVEAVDGFDGVEFVGEAA